MSMSLLGFEMSVLLYFFSFLTLDTSHSEDVRIHCGPSQRDFPGAWGWEEVRTGDVHMVSYSWLS